MREKMYRYAPDAPAILLSGGLILWLITFLIDRHYNHNQGLIWMPFLIIQIAITIICGILLKKFHQQVHTDALTGLHSRKYFNLKLSELKTKGPISLLLIDQ